MARLKTAFISMALATTAFAQGVIDVHSHIITPELVSSLTSERRLMEEGFPLPKYDVARKKWGGSWHIPTTEQFEKLNDPSITLEAASLNGTLGLKITASNGNRIFLPYTGQKVERDFGYDLYTPLEYWTSSATSDFQDWCLVSDAHAEHNNYVYDPDVNGPPNDDYKSGFACVHKPRGVGLPVRAVQ